MSDPRSMLERALGLGSFGKVRVGTQERLSQVTKALKLLAWTKMGKSP